MAESSSSRTSTAAQLAVAVAGGANAAGRAEAIGMIGMVEEFRGKRVGVVLLDSRQIVATLFSYDTHTNLLLRDAVEFMPADDEVVPASTDASEKEEGSHRVAPSVVEVPIGALMVRGADVMAIGLIDTVEEAQGQR